MDAGLIDFSTFEHQGWQRVAGEFDEIWGGLTQLFIPHLLGAVGVKAGEWVLDIACGPGYAAQAARSMGAQSIGVDFSSEMIRVARDRNPKIEFREADAQALDFDANTFDVVVMNFGVLHLSDPEAAFVEAYRVLRSGGRYGFTVWAGPDQSPGAQLVEEVMKAHADMTVKLPQGPDYFAYSDSDQCRAALAKTGFGSETFKFETVTMEWQLPYASFLFESEREHGVRSAALLAAQSQEDLQAIEADMESRVGEYLKEEAFAIPYAAHVASAVKISG